MSGKPDHSHAVPSPSWVSGVLLVLCGTVLQVNAAPGDVLFSDDFEATSLSCEWSQGISRVDTTDQTSNSGDLAAALFHSTSSMTLRQGVDATAGAVTLSAWIRRGDDTFSENPDSGEDLSVEYLNSGGSWLSVATYAGNGTPGEIISLSTTLPADAQHGGLQIRFSFARGSGDPWDFWHVDDVTLSNSSGTLFTDDFEDGLAGCDWELSPVHINLSTQTAQGGARALAINYDTAHVTLRDPIDTTSISPRIQAWVRRGDDSFSENPDAGEDLAVEYQDGSGTWQTLITYPGNGTPGEVITLDTGFPADASHANFRFRFSFASGSGATYDFWHIDDVELSEGFPTVCDAFDDLTGFTFTGSGNAFLSTATFGSAPTSVYFGDSAVTGTSTARDMSGGVQSVSLWLRRGLSPDAASDLVIEYIDDTGTWIELETFEGSGTAGEIFTPNYSLSGVPAAAHSAFQVRLRMVGGSGYWRFDDLCITGTDSVSTATNLAVEHDGGGQYCVEEQITIRALDASGDPQVAYVGTVDVTASTGLGAWRNISGNGTLTDVDANDGAATYVFDAADSGEVVLGLTISTGADTVDVDAADRANGISDDDSEGTLILRPADLVLTANAVPDPAPASIVDPLGAQVAAQDFTIHLTATSSCGVVDGFTGVRTLQFSHAWVDPISGSSNASIDSTGIGDASSPTSIPVTFTNGRAQVTANYADAGAIRITAADSTAGTSTDTGSLVVRPADLVITQISSLGGSANPMPVDLDGAAFVAAGSAFQVTVEARNAVGALTPNFGQESAAEGIRLVSDQLVLPGGGVNGPADDGALLNATNFATLVAGRFQNQQVAFDEVGIIRIRAEVSDGDYLGSGALVGSVTGNVGRFVPANFEYISGALTPACSAFTYMDQPALGISATLLARASTGTTVSNYDAALLGGRTAAVSLVAENDNSGAALSSRLSASVSSWTNGQYQITDTTAVFARSGAPDGPFDNLSIGVAVNDATDGVELASPNLRVDTSSDCVTTGDCDANQIGSTALRYGRLLALPAQGPENRDLSMTLQAQQWNGDFVLNGDDQCSTYLATAMTLSSYTDGLALGETTVTLPVVSTVLLAGRENNPPPTLSAPGIGNEGSVLVEFAVPSWLQFDWSGSGDEDPSARATFGRFRGHDRVMIWRETTQ